MSTFEFFDLETLLNHPPKRWMYKGLMGYNDLVMIYGMAWSGKTLVAIDLMLSFITRSDFGCFKFCQKDERPLSVLYCTDEGIDGLSERFRASLHKYEIEPHEVNGNLYFSKKLPNLFLPKHQLNVDKFIKDIKTKYPGPFSPRIIIIDTLKNATIGSSENSNDDAATIASVIKRIRDELDCTVILIHHSDKSGRWMRGASAFLGDMDCIIKIEHSGEVGKLSVEKIKDGSQIEPQSFKIVSQNGSQSVTIEWSGLYQDGGEKCLEYLKCNTPTKFTARQVAEALSMQQPNVIRDLKKLASDNGVVYSSLLDPEKMGSSHNPMVYWYSDSIWD